jgi:hypothetical protein
MIFLFTGLGLKYQKTQGSRCKSPQTQTTPAVDGGFIFNKDEGSFAISTGRRGMEKLGPHDLIWTAQIRLDLIRTGI